MVWMFRAPERSACSSAEAREDSSVRRPCSSWVRALSSCTLAERSWVTPSAMVMTPDVTSSAMEATSESSSSRRICSFSRSSVSRHRLASSAACSHEVFSAAIRSSSSARSACSWMYSGSFSMAASCSAFSSSVRESSCRMASIRA